MISLALRCARRGMESNDGEEKGGGSYYEVVRRLVINGC